ncbi:MAG: DNA primase [Candidatus Pacebacteria bacterium]|nr:DNA primase [Candidatus Paceibacterota bacterium]
MATDTVQQIKDRLSIVDVVSQYVKLERAGGSLRARCPFHAERTPSFHVSPERGTYHCFGCSVGGDIFSFIEAIEGLDFKGALKVLAEKAGVELTYEKPEQRDSRDRLFELLETATIFYTSRLNDEAKKYLTERGLTDGTVQQFRVGWAGDSWSEASDHFKSKKFTDNEIIDAGLAKKNERGGLSDKFRNRIMFPIADPAGRIVGFSGRIFGPKASPEAPKYLNSPETPLFHKSRILYGFDKAKQSIRKHNFAILVEGQMDLLASHEAGWGNTVAVSGTAFTPEHVTLIKRMTENLVIALDADQAGIKAAGKAARVALQGGMNVKVAQLPTGSDPADLILKEGVEAWRAAIRDSKDIITFLMDVLYEHAYAPDLPAQAGRDKFRRNVEAVVLPFLSDVQSPIAREQYVREIARRLNVSEGAVMETFNNVPRARTEAAGRQETPVGERAHLSDKVRQAFALLVWQESMPQRAFDTNVFELDLRDALGEQTLNDLRALPPADIEAMRFLAADMFRAVSQLDREAAQITQALLRQRVQSEITLLTQEIRDAEMRGDQAAVDKSFEMLNKLRERLAQISA